MWEYTLLTAFFSSFFSLFYAKCSVLGPGAAVGERVLQFCALRTPVVSDKFHSCSTSLWCLISVPYMPILWVWLSFLVLLSKYKRSTCICYSVFRDSVFRIVISQFYRHTSPLCFCCSRVAVDIGVMARSMQFVVRQNWIGNGNANYHLGTWAYYSTPGDFSFLIPKIR